MEFFTVSKNKRPVRLSEETRQFAWDSLNHVYGQDTKKNLAVSMDDIKGFKDLSDIDKYDLMIRRIAENAPVRICPGEKISGAATLWGSVQHMIPATYEGNLFFRSISHLTIGFENVIKRGINAIYEDVLLSMKNHSEPDKIRFLESCLATIDSMKIWHKRYIDALSKDGQYEENVKALSKVPFEPATNFREAVQSMWLTFAFVRLTGNWPGFGRIDYMLGDFLKKDLADGTLTISEAREILAHFFIKGVEWAAGGDYVTGDAQHYQNLVISGTDENGNDITNEVTYLVLDIIEELGISDFPTSVRLNENTDEKLLKRCAEVLRFGGGILAFYNEDTAMKALENYGYPKEEVWKFANDGCWEIQIPGKTFFSYTHFDALQILQYQTLQEYSGRAKYDSFEELYQKFMYDMGDHIRNLELYYKNECTCQDDPQKWIPNTPCTAVSLFEEGCIEKGLSYSEGGPVYNIMSVHLGGLADVANSLYAIKKVVFDEKLVTFDEFLEILKNNWEGNELLRQRVLNNYLYYGNDNDEVDEIAARISSDFAEKCAWGDKMCGYAFPPGISTFGRQVDYVPKRLASPHGHKRGEILAANSSPTPGSDRDGATAIIKSQCKADLWKLGTGCALDMKILPSSVEGDDGIDAIVSLLRGYVALGGFFIQPDVEDREILKEAQLHPENYQTLSVRVSGWNARFVTLCKEWQDMVINESK